MAFVLHAYAFGINVHCGRNMVYLVCIVVLLVKSSLCIWSCLVSPIYGESCHYNGIVVLKAFSSISFVSYFLKSINC